MRVEDHRDWTRRDVLAAGLAAAGALTLGSLGVRAQPPDDPAAGPFKLGIQSYSLRGYPKLDDALARTKELGLGYWEAYPAHIPVSADPAALAAAKASAASAGVQVIGYGVIKFTRDVDKNRPFFEFARAMGIGYLSADPDPDSFDGLDKLVDEYKVPIGIHNHGPGHRYDKIDTIQAAIKDHHPLVGVCNDTGHFLRSREDPVRAVEVFGKRTFGVHLKDVKDATTFTVLGAGDLRLADLLKALAAIRYSYAVAIEYEENPKDPIAEIQACLAAYRKAVATLPTS